MLCFRKISFEVKIFNCCKSIHKISTKRNDNNTLYSYPNIHILKRKDNPSLNETVKEKAYQALKEMDNNYDSKIKEASGNELLLSSIGDISDKYTMIYKISKDKNCIQILGKNFVNNNINKAVIIYNNNIIGLQEVIEMKDINEEQLKIEILLNKNVNDLSCMFENCESLLQLMDSNDINEIALKIKINILILLRCLKIVLLYYHCQTYQNGILIMLLI